MAFRSSRTFVSMPDCSVGPTPASTQSVRTTPVVFGSRRRCHSSGRCDEPLVDYRQHQPCHSDSMSCLRKGAQSRITTAALMGEHRDRTNSSVTSAPSASFPHLSPSGHAAEGSVTRRAHRTPRSTSAAERPSASTFSSVCSKENVWGRWTSPAPDPTARNA